MRGDRQELHRVFGDDPGAWLPKGRHVGPDRWAIVVVGAGVARTVIVQLSDVWRAGNTLWRSLSWDPVLDDSDPERISRYLPRLDGELGLHAIDGRASLVLDARYQPPGGPLGATLDALLALHRVARGTSDRFLADVAARLAEAAPTAREPVFSESEGANPAMDDPRA